MLNLYFFQLQSGQIRWWVGDAVEDLGTRRIVMLLGQVAHATSGRLVGEVSLRP